MISDRNSARLMIVREPEAAVLRWTVVRQRALEVGKVVLIVDCGGGTVDVCALIVQEVQGGLPFFRELVYPTGGRWGSTTVDEEFKKVVARLMGQQAFEAFGKTAGMISLMEGWEVAKCRFDPGRAGPTSINFNDVVDYLRQAEPGGGVDLDTLTAAYNRGIREQGLPADHQLRVHGNPRSASWKMGDIRQILVKHTEQTDPGATITL
jgi:hypothetical protein